MEEALSYLWTLPIVWILYKLRQLDETQRACDRVTRKEVSAMIRDKTEGLHEDVTEVKKTMNVMSENIVKMGVTIARMDERSKSRHASFMERHND